MEYYSLSLKELAEWYNFKQAIVEYSVNGYIADVGVECYELKNFFEYSEYDPFFDEDESNYEKHYRKINTGNFVFEVNVTHSMEEKKILAFQCHSVPFLEFKPQQIEEGFIFTVTAVHIPDFLVYLLEKVKIFLSKEFEDELFELGKKMYENARENELKKELRIEVINQLAKELENVNFRQHISRVQFEKMNTITAQVYKTKVKTEELLYQIKYKTYLLSSISKLHEEYKVKVLIGEKTSTSKEKVVGFSFLLPDKYLYGQQLKEIMQYVLSELKNKP